MCDASSLATVSMAGQVGGAGTAVVGSYFGAQAQRSSLSYQAGVSDINAQGAERTAQAALLAGQRQEQAIRLSTAQLKSKQVTSMAANGIDIGAGGAAHILASTDLLGEIDANTANANAVRSAWGYRTQATNATNDALMRRAGADSISPFTAAASSILGNAGTVAQSWYRLKQAGAWNSSLTAGPWASNGPGE